MAFNRNSQHDSVHRQAFAHYLRTGRRLTNAEWLAEHERKFNPYHDERGRFTSPPGVTVSWGHYGPRTGEPSPTGRSRSRSGARSAARKPPRTPQKRPGSDAGHSRLEAPTGLESTFVRSSVAQGTPASSYFELNKRQTGLNRLREAAGPHPSAAVRSDLDEIQKRLDADRARLDDLTRRVVEPATTEILRAGLAPADSIFGAINIASGKGDLRDKFAVLAALPIGKAAKLGQQVAQPAVRKLAQLGGPAWKVRRLKPRGYEFNHIPPDSVNGLRRGEGPGIAMLKEHHIRTASHGRMRGSKAYREIQRGLIQEGKFREAIEMDIRNIRAEFGNQYDEAIEEMLRYIDRKGY
jgi:hypothetical protein